MLNFFLLSLVAIVFTASSGTAIGKMHEMIWSDEFDGNTVNTSKWNANPEDILPIPYANEKQYYAAENVAVKNGMLEITARKQVMLDRNYTSGHIDTYGLFSTRYGRVEARIKLPKSPQILGAFLLTGDNIGAVDYIESGAINVVKSGATSNRICASVKSSWGIDEMKCVPATSKFHVYAVEWDADEINWFIDSTKYHTHTKKEGFNGTDVFLNSKFFFTLEMAVQEDFNDNDGKPIKSMYVDYVRVYN